MIKTDGYRTTKRACYLGNATHALVNNLAPLLFIVFQASYGLSYRQLGTLVSVNFAMQLVMDGLCIRYADRIGYRIPLVASQAMCASGLVLLGVLPLVMENTFLALLLAVMVYAAGGGLLEVLLSPVIGNLPMPAEEKGSAISMLHAFYCWGQTVTILASTLLLQAVGRSLWFLLPMLWAVLPFCNLFALAKVPLPETLPQDKAMSLRSLLRSPVFFTFMLLMMCAGASELTMSQWASLFAEQGLGLSKVWGDILGPCLFGVMMALGRTIYGLWGKRIDLRRLMMLCGALCVLCYLGATLAPSPVVNLAACTLSGLAVCIMWPGTFTLASGRFPLGGTALFAILALMGDLGCSTGPWLAGWVADRADRSGVFYTVNQALFAGQSGLAVGLLTSAVFPAALLILLLLSNRGRVTGAKQ